MAAKVRRRRARQPVPQKRTQPQPQRKSNRQRNQWKQQRRRRKLRRLRPHRQRVPLPHLSNRPSPMLSRQKLHPRLQLPNRRNLKQRKQILKSLWQKVAAEMPAAPVTVEQSARERASKICVAASRVHWCERLPVNTTSTSP